MIEKIKEIGMLLGCIIIAIWVAYCLGGKELFKAFE